MQGLPIIGFEGLYLVFPDGSVHSLRKNKPVTPVANEKGYLRVRLVIQGITKWFFVHRLVGKTFISNPKDLPQINHINGNKLDNRIENLEWVSLQDNVTHAISTGLSPNKVCLTIGEIATAFDKYVSGYSLSNLQKEYKVGVSINKWIKDYAKEHNKLTEFHMAKRKKCSEVGLKHRKNVYKVLQKTQDFILVREFHSVKEASEYTGISRPTIAKGTKNPSMLHRGFLWEKQYVT